jgi:hypothetical protein
MTIEEQSLRELLASSHGEACGRAIIECLQNGGELTITMSDGRVLALATIEEARLALARQFNWSHPLEE